MAEDVKGAPTQPVGKRSIDKERRSYMPKVIKRKETEFKSVWANGEDVIGAGTVSCRAYGRGPILDNYARKRRHSLGNRTSYCEARS
jgi:hypothetical protein